MEPSRQRGTGAGAIALRGAALKLQPNAVRDLTVEERDFSPRVEVALDFELTVPIWVADRNPQTRERIPSHRVTQVIE